MKKVILSRTDNLGDVVLTLPMAGLLKRRFPGIHIIFLGKAYTRPLIEACEHVDEFWDREEIVGRETSDVRRKTLDVRRPTFYGIDAVFHVFPDREVMRWAKRAGIPLRVGTSHRWYSWLYCNKLVHYSRKKSNLHESQLNMKLLEAVGISGEVSLEEIGEMFGLVRRKTWDVGRETSYVLPLTSYKLILHPKSKGSAREWGLENFSRLIELLPPERYEIFITGTKEEGDQMKEFLAQHRDRVTDLTGRLTLAELIALIDSCDALVAASTGPLHIAAALGKRAVGIYAPMRPIFPQRWAPLGKNACYLVLDKECTDCRKSMDCACIRSITPEQVMGKL